MSSHNAVMRKRAQASAEDRGMLQLCLMMLWLQACSNGVLSNNDTALVHECVCLHMFTNSRVREQMTSVHLDNSCIMGTNFAQLCNQFCPIMQPMMLQR